jgi:hypothetical protein
MELETAKKIVNCSNESLRIHEDYSGRGMMGVTTAGIVGSHTDLYISVECYLEQNPMEDCSPEQFIDEFRSDSMGMDFIWY